MSFADLICGCGEEAAELDAGEMPPTLSAYVINAMQAPHETLDVGPKKPPSVARDKLRRNCVRLLARREHRFERYLVRALSARDPQTSCPGLVRKPERCPPHAAALVAHALLEAAARKQADDVLQKLPRMVADGYFDGQPQDWFHARRRSLWCRANRSIDFFGFLPRERAFFRSFGVMRQDSLVAS